MAGGVIIKNQYSKDIKSIDVNGKSGHKNNINYDKYKPVFEHIENHRINQETRGKLVYNFWEIFGIRLCCCMGKYKVMKNIFDLGDQKLNYYVDYLEVITLLQDFTKLKKIIFDKKRLEIFKYTRKPKIVVNTLGEEIKELSEWPINERQLEIDDKELYTQYHYITKTNDTMEFDKRLIEQFDSDLKMSFDILIDKE